MAGCLAEIFESVYLHPAKQLAWFAQMAKLVDALPSGGSVRKDVLVRIQFWAQKPRFLSGFSFYIRKMASG